MNSHLFLFSEITEGPDKIIFYPQLNIWAYWGGEIEPGFVELQYDFGMETKVCFNSFFTVDLKTDFERICKIIEFDLFHAFFHYKGDPNYLPYHWALYGNLKERVSLFEENPLTF